MGGLFPGDNFPGGYFLGGIFPGGFFPGGIFPDTFVRKSVFVYNQLNYLGIGLILYIFRDRLSDRFVDEMAD